jgi:hypothetical protein
MATLPNQRTRPLSSRDFTTSPSFSGVSDTTPSPTDTSDSDELSLTRIVCGQVIDKRRRDRRRPPTGLMLQMRLNEVDEIFDRIMGLMDDCPEPLRLDADGDNRSIAWV